MLSLVLYFSVFAISSACLVASDREAMPQSIRFILICVAIGLPSSIAGFRSASVGTDTSNYLFNFVAISGQQIKEFIAFQGIREIGFWVLVKVLMLISSDAHFTMGIIAALTLLFTYGGLKQFETVNLPLSYFVMLCFYWSSMLNITRQTLSIAIAFYALKYLYSNKHLRFFIVVLIAATIHVATSIFLFAALFWSRKKQCTTAGRMAFMAIVTVIIIAVFPAILDRIVAYNAKYSYIMINNPSLNRDFILVIAVCIVMVVTFSRFEGKGASIQHVIALYIVSLVLLMAGLNNKSLKRLAISYAFPSITWFGSLGQVDTGYKQLITNMLVAVYASVYFIATTYIIQNGQIYPYAVFWG